ncbi:DNA polymerase III subunit alpha [Thermodesulforhabdus norvegica]|uniref:DNA-directed DNA polymerase n=1 Tax=Thermodesulforhabdus norvegica TaxID=39841 RepID=A0A1I4VDD4_9BACT|nr:DNA polymerase III subunit alpha [Thermodesulforhabdus norvegica]SFM99179.1 error-prone DNA polymerase [Thermodesulforhabdus norvegica]
MFCHLHVRSAFTFLFGTFTPEQLVRRVKALGMSSVAITDRGGLYGAVKFVKAANRAGIKPILGIEAPLSDGSILVLIVKNKEGYSNLARLITATKLAQRDVFSLDDINTYHRGLICLTGGRDGRAWKLIRSGKLVEAKEFLGLLKDIFEADLYVEIQNHSIKTDIEVSGELMRLAKKIGSKTVGTNAVTFLKKEDFIIHQILVKIQQTVHHRAISPLPCDEFYLKSEQEMSCVLPPEVFHAIGEVVEKVDFTMELFRVHPPKVFDRDTERLTELCFRNLAVRYKPVTLEVLRRLEKELNLIFSRNFSSYFLVVYDVVSWARNRGIRLSIRGSAVGSLVTYLLFGGPDPIEHNLLFERFLNEGRFDPPDIDVDFDSERRNEVIRYVFHRFKGKAAFVSTLSTYRARGAVRDVARAMGRHLGEVSELTKFLPYHLRPNEINEALKKLPELAESPLHEENELVRLVGNLSGLPRQISTHLGGIILSESLLDMVPLELSPSGFPLSQYDKDDIEKLGLPKFDFLGLRMHTAISKTLSYIKENGKALDLDNIHLNDSDTYRLLCSTETVGVFQLESPGQRQLLSRLQPKCFSDLMIEISLFRPGPMQAKMATPFIRRKHGKEPVEYFCPELKPILEETYGILVYQEQVLKMVAKLTNSSLEWADVFRRSMTHDRSPEEMEKLRVEFISRCIKSGYSRFVAEKAWKQISAFASYGFCKAHAAAFAYITYQSAYLKAHFPLEFYLGLLNSGQVGSYPPWVILNEARRRFPVYPPHVNFSRFEYTIESNGIRVGFCAVKGIGAKTAEKIVKDREAHGPFKSIPEFLARVKLSRKIFCTLFTIGAFDGLGNNEGKVA